MVSLLVLAVVIFAPSPSDFAFGINIIILRNNNGVLNFNCVISTKESLS